jgi:nitrogen regulatory protein P-II 1
LLKQIEAIVRREKFPDVDRSLRAIGVGGLTVIDARGRGRAVETEVVNVRGKWTFTHEYLHRVIISLVVEDDDVKKVVDTIVASASTSAVGDGKVFIIPIEKAIDIATGESDNDAALDLKRAKSSKK